MYLGILGYVARGGEQLARVKGWRPIVLGTDVGGRNLEGGRARLTRLLSLLTLMIMQGGRELAEVSRPNTKEPPIMILSDGTVF
jgi:hypothetical protein